MADRGPCAGPSRMRACAETDASQGFTLLSPTLHTCVTGSIIKSFHADLSVSLPLPRCALFHIFPFAFLGHTSSYADNVLATAVTANSKAQCRAAHGICCRPGGSFRRLYITHRLTPVGTYSFRCRFAKFNNVNDWHNACEKNVFSG